LASSSLLFPGCFLSFPMMPNVAFNKV
jgi:hypothetical protein